mgnify:CR=1 FL=1
MTNLDRLLKQACGSVLMVRPKKFSLNPETADSNSFQSRESLVEDKDLDALACEEFDNMVRVLREEGVDIMLFDAQREDTPDALYPNNWFSTHDDGRVFVYPMEAENRRRERRFDIFSELVDRGCQIDQVTDLSFHENDGSFLESTGSMVLDRIEKKVYACKSSRTNKELLEEFANMIGYQVVLFEAADGEGADIFHTNMMMSIGASFVIICSEVIGDLKERGKVLESLEATGRVVIDINLEQLYSFAGNVLQIRNKKGESLIIISKRGFSSMSGEQRDVLRRYGKVLAIPVNFIESCGGGGVRCMMAEVALPKG